MFSRKISLSKKGNQEIVSALFVILSLFLLHIIVKIKKRPQKINLTTAVMDTKTLFLGLGGEEVAFCVTQNIFAELLFYEPGLRGFRHVREILTLLKYIRYQRNLK